MKGELISIIMPVKSGLPYLEACLDSILSQSYNNWELLAVNDNSTDSTWEVLNRYADSDERIKPIQNAGSGILPALKTGFSHAQGSYITRMDADDLMPQAKLEKFIECWQPGSLCVGLVSYFSEAGVGAGYLNYERWLNDLTVNAANFSDIYKECVIPSACWFCSKEDFLGVGGFGRRYPEDYDLAFRFYGQSMKIVPVPEVLHKWRDHGDRASRNDPNYADNRFLDLKLSYFLELDRNDQPLVLLGAGKKGKLLAKMLVERSVDFKWHTNNENKVGHNIYGSLLERELEDYGGFQLIVAIAGEEGDKLREMHQGAFFFC